MTALATDNFNRANSADLGTSWDTQTSESALQIVSNAVTDAGNTDAAENYNAVVWPNDQYSQIKFTSTTSTWFTGDGGGVGVRHSASAKTYYRLVINDNGSSNAELGKKVAGTYTTIWTRTVTYSAGAVVYLEIQGTTLIAKYNGVAIGASTTDSSIASGRAGIVWSAENNKHISMDDWEGGEFSAGAATKAPPPHQQPWRRIIRRRVA